MCKDTKDTNTQTRDQSSYCKHANMQTCEDTKDTKDREDVKDTQTSNHATTHMQTQQ